MKSQSSNKFILFFILVATFISLSPVLQAEFINWDDNSHLTNNPLVLNLNKDTVWSHFTTTVNDTYIPLTTLSFAVEHKIFGLKPFFYHFNNLLLHLGVVSLVFMLALRMNLSSYAAGAAALIFGIHPMHVESVAWVTERKDLLYSVFYLLAVISYWDYLKTNKRYIHGFSLGWGLLSILAKPMALSLPLVLFLFDWYAQRKITVKNLLSKIAYFAYIIPIAWITYALNARNAIEYNSDALLIWIYTLSFYIQKFFFPVHLSALYDRPEPVTLENPVYVIAVLTIGLVAFLWARLGKKFPIVIFACLFYFFSIFFLLRFDIYDQNFVADRFMYLPSLGLCLVMGVLLNIIYMQISAANLNRKRVAKLFMVAFFSVCSLLTYKQSMKWKNSFLLWSHAIHHTSSNARAYAFRADAFIQSGQPQSAVYDASKAIVVNPDDALGFHYRGTAHALLGNFQQGLADFNRALKMNPDYPDTLLNRGFLYQNLGKFELALKDFNELIINNKFHYKAFTNRGGIYAVQGRDVLARNDFNRAISIYPDYVPALMNRGIYYATHQKLDLALADFQKALKIDPGDRVLLQNYARLRKEMQGNQEADREQGSN